MRMTFTELMEKLGIPQGLTPYEACPFNVYNAEKGITCNAEARMDGDPNAVEVEVQIMYDTPQPDGAMMKQIIWFVVKPQIGQDWATRDARLNAQPIDRNIYNWDEKCCTFFSELLRFLKIDQVPDIDALVDEVFHSRERFNDQMGGGGGKSPKIKPAQLLGMKTGGGGF